MNFFKNLFRKKTVPNNEKKTVSNESVYKEKEINEFINSNDTMGLFKLITSLSATEQVEALKTMGKKGGKPSIEVISAFIHDTDETIKNTAKFVLLDIINKIDLTNSLVNIKGDYYLYKSTITNIL